MSVEYKERLKEYQRNYREDKNIFHRCKKTQLIVLSEKDSKLLSQRYCLLVLVSIL